MTDPAEKLAADVGAPPVVSMGSTPSVAAVGSRAILDAGRKSLTTDTRAEGVCATRGRVD